MISRSSYETDNQYLAQQKYAWKKRLQNAMRRYRGEGRSEGQVAPLKNYLSQYAREQLKKGITKSKIDWDRVYSFIDYLYLKDYEGLMLGKYEF